MIVLGCMDLDLALRIEKPASLEDTSSSDDKKEMEKWECSNRMSLMIMKRAISESFRGTMTEENNAKVFLDDLEKPETSILLSKLVSIRYKGKGNIREYILEMSHLVPTEN